MLIEESCNTFGACLTFKINLYRMLWSDKAPQRNSHFVFIGVPHVDKSSTESKRDMPLVCTTTVAIITKYRKV